MDQPIEEKLIYTWTEFDEDVRKIAFNFTSYKPEMIIAVAKGGLPLGVKLAHHFHVPLQIISISSYSDFGKERTHPNLISTVKEWPSDTKYLLVDDCADTGETLLLASAIYLGQGHSFDAFRTATLFYKPTSKIKPDFYVRETTKWILFPWEVS